MTTALLVLAGYLAGSMPFGYWVVRLVRHVDIRTVGSGNIGASNVFRTFGPRLGLLVALLDTAKGFAPALLAALVAGPLAGVLAGAAAMLGHWRPLFLGLARGGKMVATCGGALLGVAPLVGFLAVAVWLGLFLVTRYASLGSVGAALGLPVIAFLLSEPWPVVVFTATAGLFVIVLHRSNLARLRAGTESRFEFRRARKGAAART